MSTGILTDVRIRAAIEEGDIKITPFNSEQVNPTSYDLTLGNEVVIYSDWVETYDVTGSNEPLDGRHFTPLNRCLDAKAEPKTKSFTIDPEKGWVLKPGIGYLMHTQERICTKQFVPILDGKSSIGRLFIQVHATAGFGDPGFDGQFTLEVLVQHPVRVYPGMRICQIRFQDMNGWVGQTYDKVGHYRGTEALGARPSQAWRQFR